MKTAKDNTSNSCSILRIVDKKRRRNRESSMLYWQQMIFESLNCTTRLSYLTNKHKTMSSMFGIPRNIEGIWNICEHSFSRDVSTKVDNGKNGADSIVASAWNYPIILLERFYYPIGWRIIHNGLILARWRFEITQHNKKSVSGEKNGFLFL